MSDRRLERRRGRLPDARTRIVTGTNRRNDTGGSSGSSDSSDTDTDSNIGSNSDGDGDTDRLAQVILS
ncbi:hypothetical protein GS429_03885 [Natronorubrum sp. JWXQ-INN-674]|uniref:Uncharacterized protein n=1 Tax=Natronorubrum halalkaliphilum TaxID=2691917 RepID=A0A6B0VI70_9EURY|nr:hypothetical protein [Natronorubrum halalkaliphilum]MXV61214.1 hypothetical protein [Natronorubrum halalkaliphilum]